MWVAIRIMFTDSLDFFLYIGCMFVSAWVFVPPAVECILDLTTVWMYKKEHQQRLKRRNLLSIEVCWIQVPSIDTFKKYMKVIRCSYP